MLYFSFAMSKVLKKSIIKNNKPDLIIISSPHPFVWPIIHRIATKDIKIIFEERDIWPESMIEFAKMSSINPFVIYFKNLMNKIGKQADGVISLLPGTEHRFANLGQPKGQWIWIPNGVDLSDTEKSFSRAPDTHILALQAAKKEKKLVVLYAGAMGPPNYLESILELANIEGEKNYKFFLMGDGVSRIKLEKYVEKHNIKFIQFLPKINRQQSWHVMQNSDIGFFTAKKSYLYTEYGISFNKIYDYFSQKLPVIGVFDAKNNLINKSQAGYSVSVDDPIMLNETLNFIAKQPSELLKSFGNNGYNYLQKHNDWLVLGKRYSDFCEQIVGLQ
jgi:glycosyltransferase involved in cell wall biosynthesis